MNMNGFNRNLVFLCAEDGRISHKDVAVLLHTSSQRVHYARAVLEREGIIHTPHVIFDYSYFNLIQFRVYFKGGYVGEKDKQAILALLRENPYLVSIYELNGEFDLSIELESPNPSRFNKELKRLISLQPSLSHYKVLLTLVTHLYPRFYLPNNEVLTSRFPQSIVIGGDRYPEQFTSSELAMMRVLLDKPLERLSVIARASSLNIKTTSNLLKNLQQRKCIRGFQYLVDAGKVGISKFRLFLKLHNLTQEREVVLMEYLLNTKEVVQTSKTVGDWDLEVDIESLDKTRIRAVIRELREQFSGIIESFNQMEYFASYTRSYLPRYIFGEEK
ncbi:Lrp/AsnC family transcriptional regulator [Candidatus Woesearchaeota archaeon]|nr:Lrp/AsnC family transcriptional regulator [Candidatus Woesearchaeota archaeon]